VLHPQWDLVDISIWWHGHHMVHQLWCILNYYRITISGLSSPVSLSISTQEKNLTKLFRYRNLTEITNMLMIVVILWSVLHKSATWDLFTIPMNCFHGCSVPISYFYWSSTGGRTKSTSTLIAVGTKWMSRQNSTKSKRVQHCPGLGCEPDKVSS